MLAGVPSLRRTGRPCVEARTVHRQRTSPRLPAHVQPDSARKESTVPLHVARSADYSDAGSTLSASTGPLSATAKMVLGDIGGTNARFELVEANVSTGERLGDSLVQIKPTREFPTFASAMKAFLDEQGVSSSDVDACCIAVAGPVAGNAVRMTNLDWSIDGSELEAEFGFRVAVLNDFVAIGYAVPHIPTADLLTVNDRPRENGGPIAVLGPGTGLGQTQLLWDSGVGGYVAWASEGSHAGFAPRGALQRELLEFAEDELEMPCEVEHVACGTGLKRLYRFVCSRAGVEANSDWTPADITTNALKADCPHCSEAIDLFLDIIGAEAGAMALRNMATGGVYIAGGILPRILPKIEGNEALRDSFLNVNSRFSSVLQRFPLFVLTKEAGLEGVYQYALQLAQNRR